MAEICHYSVITRSKYLAGEFPNTAHGCKWHGVVTARHTLEWSGSIIPISRTFSLLEADSHTHTHSMCFWNEYKCLVVHLQCFPSLTAFTPHLCQQVVMWSLQQLLMPFKLSIILQSLEVIKERWPLDVHYIACQQKPPPPITRSTFLHVSGVCVLLFI